MHFLFANFCFYIKLWFGGLKSDIIFIIQLIWIKNGIYLDPSRIQPFICFVPIPSFF